MKLGDKSGGSERQGSWTQAATIEQFLSHTLPTAPSPTTTHFMVCISFRNFQKISQNCASDSVSLERKGVRCEGCNWGRRRGEVITSVEGMQYSRFSGPKKMDGWRGREVDELETE